MYKPVMALEKREGSSLTCSFCGKSQKEVKKLIAGPTVYICDECLGLCNDIIAEEVDKDDQQFPTTIPKPAQIKKVLDEYVIGQDRAKKVADEAEKIWRAGRNWIDPDEKRPEAGREDWIQAAGVYGRMVARFPDHPIADQTLLGQANALFQAQEWVKAKAVFDAFPRGYPTSVHLPKAMYWSGMCSLKANDVKGCYLQFLRLLQDYPESTEAKLARGVLLEDGRFAELEVMKDLQKQE